VTYTEPGVEQTVERLLAEADLAGPLNPEQLNVHDQYHIGGLAAVDRTIGPMRLTANDRVVDIGSGFGGPARRIAELTGATVHGVDITASYVDTATALTRRCGLDDRVTFEHNGIEDHHPQRRYTAAISMHVCMNVADKPRWYRAIADRLPEGAQFGIWDVVRIADGPVTFPVPWSMDGTDSFLDSPEQLHAAITGAGFETREWVDESGWVRDWVTQTFGAGLPPGPGIPMVIDDGFTRTINFGAALAAGTLGVYRGLFTKTTP
jgi:SAM-dependent methyltransferase